MAPRPIQLLWFAGAAVFILALFHTLGGGESSAVKDWVSTTMAGKVGSSNSGGAGGRVSLQEHMRLAEKSWQKSVKQRHELLKEWPSPDKMPLFAATDSASYFKTPYSIWDFVPASWSCPHEVERIGRMGDGGKWVCGFSKYELLPKEKPCIIYSFGVQFESSYEDETIARTHCEIWAYDFSVAEFGKQLSPEHKLRAHFTQAGISGETDTTKAPPFYTIHDLMKKNGHDYIDILKIDIEYSEFASLTALSEAFPSASGYEFPIGQILIEIHLFGYKGITSGEFLNWWESLEARGMRPVWTEPNLLYTTLALEGGDPRLAEYTLVNTVDRRSVLFGGATLP